MARVTTVITSIDSTTSESVTVDSTSWSTDSGTITLSAAVPAAVKVGDVIADSAANSYLITGISGSVLTCQDFDSTTDPATGAGTISETYATVTLWEADWDAGTNSEVYKSGDDCIGEAYANAAFDESVGFTGGSTIGLNSTKLTVPESERHDGTAGSGTRNVRTGANGFSPNASSIAITIEWFEIDMGDNSGDAINDSDTGVRIFSKCILHDGLGFATRGVFIGAASGAVIFNNIIYGFVSDNTFAVKGAGILAEPTFDMQVLNNTVHNNTHTGTGTHFGIDFVDATDTDIQNNICTDNDTDYTPASPSTATVDHNLSSDTTASGTGSLTNKLSADIYVSKVVGSEDLHEKAGAPSIDTGIDLGTTPTNVNFDINNRDRDAGV